MKPRIGPARLLVLLALALFALPGWAREFHVSIRGDDAGGGTRSAPFRTIQHAAELAQPGDVVTVHAGTYREEVSPPRGGLSEAKRIVYQAAPREHVIITGSGRMTNWVKLQGDVWTATLPNAFFGRFNPYRDLIHGDWFDPKGRAHHTGAVYLNGDWLTEAASLEEVLQPAGAKPPWLVQAQKDAARRVNPQLWFGRVDSTQTMLWAQFDGINPNEQQVEINVRRTVFYPEKEGCNFITVRGFTLCNAATPWAPPTAEQIGLIGTHWSRGWIIENNDVRYSVCSGIALGKYGDEFDNTSADTAEGYVKTIERAYAHPIPWSKAAVGHHLVRHNSISHCEQAGIVGSLGAAFSTISGNIIHDIHVRRLFGGAEMAGIKFHGAVDTTIRGNHIYRTCLGLWLDWMAQGTRVTGNLFHDNAGEDLFVEVDHGPFVVDNNLLLSRTSLLDMSEGGAYLHNLFAGRITNRPEPARQTPFLQAHSTATAGLVDVKGGDDRFYNNLFVGDGKVSSKSGRPAGKNLEWISSQGLWGYDTRDLPLQTGGNVFYNGAEPYAQEKDPLIIETRIPDLKPTWQNGRLSLPLRFGPDSRQAKTTLITTALLGKSAVAGLPYENPDGSPLTLDTDFFGKKRAHKPVPGPFERSPEKEWTFHFDR